MVLVKCEWCKKDSYLPTYYRNKKMNIRRFCSARCKSFWIGSKTRIDPEYRRKKSIISIRNGSLPPVIKKRNDSWKIKRKDWERDASKNSRFRFFRLEVLKRDSFQCVKCGSKEKVHIHHIKTWKDFPELRYEPTNCIILCRQCHILEHNPKLKTTA